MSKREEKLDADLRSMGYDPVELGRIGWKLAMKCMGDNYQKMLDASGATIERQEKEIAHLNAIITGLRMRLEPSADQG